MTRTLILSALLALSACGGGGGSSDPSPPLTVSAGADQTVAPLTRVALVPSSALAVDRWEWTQVSGPEVLSARGPDGVLTLNAPAFPSRLEFEVRGLGAADEVLGADRAFVTVASPLPAPLVQTVATLDVGGGGAGRATGVALHESSRRLFVVDEVDARVVVYDVQNPSVPGFAGVVTAPPVIPGYTPGRPLAVAAGATGDVAITWSDGEGDDFPGRLQLVDPLTLAELRTFSTTGARPVDIDMTADGSLIAIACGGDRTVTTQGDGRGYITLVKVPPAGALSIDPHSDIAPIPFSAFDGTESELAQAGVRFLGPFAPDASIDLAPRAVALSEDGTRAWAACAENNCVIAVDVEAQLALGVSALGARANGAADRGAFLDGSRRTWTESPSLVSTPAGDAIPVGGFQGLVDMTEDQAGLRLRLVAGSGPTLAPVDLDGDGTPELPFVAPERGLAVFDVIFGPNGNIASVERAIELRDAAGEPITGLPEAYPSSAGLAGHDERAVGLDGAARVAPGLGARLSGATVGPSNEIWCADARRAAVWRFRADGGLVQRYVPDGSSPGLGQPALPAAFARRRVQLSESEGRRFGGLGGIAYDPARGSILAIARLPLDTPDTADDAASKASQILRLLELDPSSGAVIGEYAVPTSGAEHAAEGLAMGPASAPFDAAPVLLESGPEVDGLRALFRLEIDGATNLRTLSPADYAAIDAALEGTAPSALSELTPPVVPVARTLALDLGPVSSGASAPSALGFFGDRLAVVHDDGRLGTSAAGFDPGSGALSGPVPARAGVLLEGRARGLVLDTATDGAAAAGTDFVPVLALDQPTDIVALGSGADGRVLLANGGAPRVLLDLVGSVGFDERVAVEDLVLDSAVYPNAAQWQPVPFGGTLQVSLIDADRGGDGLADRLAVLGSRSVSMIGAEGQLLWSSGAPLVDWARALRPARVDVASESQGIEPSAITCVEVGGRLCSISALTGAGLVAVHDLGSPRTPRLAGLAATAQRPSAIASYRTGTSALIAVADAEAGRVLLQRVTQ